MPAILTKAISCHRLVAAGAAISVSTLLRDRHGIPSRLLVLIACTAVGTMQAGWAQGATEPTDPKSVVLKPGNNVVELVQSNRHVRKVLIELPPGNREGERLPVVFGFHGDGGPAEAYHQRLSPYVRKHHIISVSPQGETMGTGKQGGSITFFNFIPGKKDWAHQQADDLGLVRQILELLDVHQLSDPHRIYATGGSAGGHMCNMLAKETDLFAAIAPTKCGMVKSMHEPTEGNKRTPLFWVMGDQDKSFKGGGSSEFVNHPVSARIELWRQFNQCEGAAKIQSLPEMTLETYLAKDGVEVTLCTLPGITHAIPRELAAKTDALIIEFFLRHRK